MPLKVDCASHVETVPMLAINVLRGFYLVISILASLIDITDRLSTGWSNYCYCLADRILVTCRWSSVCSRYLSSGWVWLSTTAGGYDADSGIGWSYCWEGRVLSQLSLSLKAINDLRTILFHRLPTISDGVMRLPADAPMLTVSEDRALKGFLSYGWYFKS